MLIFHLHGGPHTVMCQVVSDKYNSAICRKILFTAITIFYRLLMTSRRGWLVIKCC
jgi:hypothetical protein